MSYDNSEAKLLVYISLQPIDQSKKLNFIEPTYHNNYKHVRRKTLHLQLPV